MFNDILYQFIWGIFNVPRIRVTDLIACWDPAPVNPAVMIACAVSVIMVILFDRNGLARRPRPSLDSESARTVGNRRCVGATLEDPGDP